MLLPPTCTPALPLVDMRAHQHRNREQDAHDAEHKRTGVESSRLLTPALATSGVQQPEMCSDLSYCTRQLVLGDVQIPLARYLLAQFVRLLVLVGLNLAGKTEGCE